MHVKNHFALIPWQFQSKSLQTLWEFEYWGFERSWWFFSITYIAIKIFHLVNNNYSICGCQLGKSRTMNRGKKNIHKQKASTSWQVNYSSKIKICKYAIAIHLNNGEIFFLYQKKCQINTSSSEIFNRYNVSIFTLLCKHNKANHLEDMLSKQR